MTKTEKKPMYLKDLKNLEVYAKINLPLSAKINLSLSAKINLPLSASSSLSMKIKCLFKNGWLLYVQGQLREFENKQ